MSFFCLGAWGALYAYTPELYPTQIRSTSMGAASGMTRIAGALAPLLGASLLTTNFVGGLTLYAIAFILGGIVVLVLGPETQGQPLSDTLEIGEISQPFKTQFGFHIVKLEDRQEARSVSLEDDWDSISSFTLQRKQMIFFENWVQELRQDVFIDVKEELLNLEQ